MVCLWRRVLFLSFLGPKIQASGAPPDPREPLLIAPLVAGEARAMLPIDRPRKAQRGEADAVL